MILQRSTKNNFTCTNLQKLRPGGTKIEVWRRFGGVHRRLGASWKHFGESWRNLSLLGGVLGVSWAVLEPSWNHLEGVQGTSSGRLGPSWAVLGRHMGPSWAVIWKSWSRLLGILCPIFNPKGVRLRHAILMSFFNWFLKDFASKNLSPNLEKSLNSIGKICIFCFQNFLTRHRFWMWFWSHIGSILAVKSTSKIDLNHMKNWFGFLPRCSKVLPNNSW